MFDLGMKKSISFCIPTIVVGNLSLGGTGKTPMVEFLIKKLKSHYRTVTLSRGYGRKSSGYMMVRDGLTHRDVGDEPFQIFTKFGKDIHVAVGEERILAIPFILTELPDTELILLDDAYQHRYVAGDLNILLTTYQKPFFRDRIIPMGTLRESRRGATRADIIVVTKCPAHLDPDIRQEYIQKITTYSKKDCLIIFGRFNYGEPYHIFNPQQKMDKGVILITGIADNRVLIEEVGRKYTLLDTLEYPDHHHYTLKDISRLLKLYHQHLGSNPSILTTEKDAVKLKDAKFKEYLKEIPIFALPVEIILTQKEEKALLLKSAKAIGKKHKISEA
jgi:tetraacyldisaccharide 4'-kinase